MQLELFPDLALSHDGEVGFTLSAEDVNGEMVVLDVFNDLDPLVERLRHELAHFADIEGLFDVSACFKEFSYRFYEQATVLQDHLEGQGELDFDNYGGDNHGD